jgi:LmbE family N-acetylglucosaminyl deacetylase
MFNRILVLSPHTDDGELGCGGSIAKFVSEGKEVFYAAFSICEKSVPKSCPSNILETEVKAATKTLGIPKENLMLYKFEVREFPKLRQEILDTMLDIRSTVKPDIVFTPSSFDTHQDHEVIRQETLRAYKMSSILGYEQPWNNITFNTSCFITLEDKHIKKKTAALKCYESQKSRTYLTEEYIRSLAQTRGVQINAKYAEAFEAIRWIIK